MSIELNKPVFAALLANKTASAAICLIAVVQVGLVALGVRGWVCPLLSVTGCPCPGCGLTRASAALLRGDWRLSLTLHAFAPILLAALALLGFSLFLPSRLHLRLGAAIEKIERRTGFTTIVFVGLLVYWIVRLFFIPASLALVVER
jgi:hypothetical protein